MFRNTIFIFLFSALVFNLIQCEVYRLSKNVKPIRYFLTLEPNLIDTYIENSITFDGSVTIELEILENTNNITLHQSELKINATSVVLNGQNGEEINPSSTSADEDTETYTIQFESELLKKQKYNLTIGSFSGELRPDKGFLKAVYYINNLQSKPRNLAATQFEPTAARLAFPCFDEPALKARFIISLIRNKQYHSLSNTQLNYTEDLGNDRFKDTFEETPLMSTYTVAFTVSDLKSTKTIDRLQIFAMQWEIEQGKADQALEVSVLILQALEEYTGINFTLSKIDQFAVPPMNFEQVAMENWGLVIYDAPELLQNNESSVNEYQKSVMVIAHEFAHQWFGNLVTAEWWDYLWLSESFAAYFQYYIVGVVKPTWRAMDQFVVDKVQLGLWNEEDELSQSLNHPIEFSGDIPPNHIIYQKGAAIVRMAEHFLTHNVFRRGIQKYLKDNQFGATVPDDLYKALQEAVDEAKANYLLQNLTVAEIYKTWADNDAFPVITVTRNYATGFVTIEQVPRFDTKDTSAQWIIPINVVFSARNKIDFSQTTADYWLQNKSMTINDNFPTNGWLIINKQQTGYYRVNYDLENWERIIEFLNTANFTSIHPANRAQLINDAFNCASRGLLPWDLPLRLCEYLVRERDYVPFAAFHQSLRNYVIVSETNRYKKNQFRYFKNYTLSNLIENNPEATEYDAYKEYLQTVMSGVRQDLGFESKPTDTHMDKLTRAVFANFRHILS